MGTPLENDPTRQSLLSRIGKRLGERLGFLLSPEEEAKILEEAEKRRWHEERQDQLAHALAYSDACPSEAEYVLGLRDDDPHPDHAIQFDPRFPPPDLTDESIVKRAPPSSNAVYGPHDVNHPI